MHPWPRGQGLGKDHNGIVDPIELKQNQGNLGVGGVACLFIQLGSAGRVPEKESQWHNWWDDLYNRAAQNVAGKSIVAKDVDAIAPAQSNGAPGPPKATNPNKTIDLNNFNAPDL
ncbi:G-patch domain [Babesia duncani]|uniref:G-patch domain n=1 Tax=Babesia duncani TaxID=323732 RepID=A0AAD9PLG6_9APIC|nr:G-patch domain [Babesia duncani]